MLIFGWRCYGAVDELEGQYAQTRFFHLFFLPLAPMNSYWCDRSNGGHEIKLHGPSIGAAYARWWGLGLAAGFLALATQIPAAVGVICGILAATSAAVAAYSWKQTHRADEQHRKVSDANLAAFGTRCDPKWFLDELSNERRIVLDRMWADVSGGKSPSDVARFGAENAQQATVAYGLLRLSALKGETEADAEAMRIVDSVRELPAPSPYREPANVPAGPSEGAPEKAPPIARDALGGFLAPLVQALESELAAENFVRVKAAPPIELVLKRQKRFDHHSVAVVHADTNYEDLATITPGFAVAIGRAVNAGNLLLVWVGAGLAQRAGGLEHALGGDTGVRGIFVVDLAERSVTIAGNKVSELTKRFRDRVGTIVQRTLDATKPG